MARARARHFHRFRLHTQLKHLILRHYLESWVRKLLLRPGGGDQVILVDAFAGEGMDQHGAHGSPVILARLAAVAEAQLERLRPGRPVEIRVLAVEENRRRVAKLRQNLAPFSARAEVRHGRLGDFLTEFIAEHRECPSMFFIDPFGVKGLEARIVREILAVPRYEILAQFSDEAALRLSAVSVAEERDLETEIRRTIAAPSLFPDLDEATRQRVRQQVERSNSALRQTRKACEQILVTAYGTHIWRDAFRLGGNSKEKRDHLIAGYRGFLDGVGGRYTTAVPVRAEDGDPIYTLLHASRSPAGRQTMKESVEWALNTSELPDPAKAEIYDDLSVDLGPIEDLLCQRFAGRRVSWTDKGGESVRRFLLQETDVFPFQLKELQGRLKNTGAFTAARAGAPAMCAFPRAALEPT